jgi:hypothetical protein
MSQSFEAKVMTDDIPVMDFVKDNSFDEDVYLIPSDLENFRIYTGVPVFIDFKSHPYKDVEVIEWYKRIHLANDFYNQSLNTSDYGTIQALKSITQEYKITGIVVRGNYPNLVNDSINMAFTDGNYTVYKINR